MSNHIKYDIKKKQDLIDLIHLMKNIKPDIIAIDTEANGLNIGVSIPFLFQAGFDKGETTYTYTVDLETYPELGKQTILATLELAEKSEYLIGHNIKFDMHMLANIGIYYKGNNLVDTMACIRLAHDALTQPNGGPPMGLKAYATAYINRGAKIHEHALDLEKTHLSKLYNIRLISAMKHFPNPPAGCKTWTKGAVEALLKDVMSTIETLPTKEMQDVYIKWYEHLPSEIRERMTKSFVVSDDIPYNMLTRESVVSYGHMDIFYTLAVYRKTIPVIKIRKNMEAFRIEQEVIEPLFQMERTGFKVNKEYVLESKAKMRAYIFKQREKLYKAAGQKLSTSQSKEVLRLLNKRFGLAITSTGANVLDQIISDLKHDKTNPAALEFMKLVQELRTLEKWYAVYLLRFINEMRASDRVYTQIYQVGTVTGRVTSDFQQFPKAGIKSQDGEELFNPRKMVLCDKSAGFVGLAYLDYSQIELRLQALYTILVGNPDLNLCRAYMPYKCYKSIEAGDNLGDGPTAFNYENPTHIAHAYDWNWVREEDHTPWTPTDVHAATTSIAFPDLDIHSDEFKKLRGKIGKRVNFAKNYGAAFNRIKQMFPNYDDETIHRIDDAYYLAFPGVKAYHTYCYELSKQSAFATNLFGVKYYGLTGHKLINTLIQGSGAYFLKLKEIEIYKYLRDNNCKSRFQMNIHDEVSFEIYAGEEHILFDIKKIMETFDESFVPIVADLEISTTTWAEKEDAGDLEDVKRLLYTETKTS